MPGLKLKHMIKIGPGCLPLILLTVSCLSPSYIIIVMRLEVKLANADGDAAGAGAGAAADDDVMAFMWNVRQM